MSRTPPCIPFDAVAQLLDAALARAGVSKAIRERVLAEEETSDVIQGQVSLVETSTGKRRIRVTEERRNGRIEEMFVFPPNTSEMEAELLRAQNTGRILTVVFRRERTGMNMIDMILVWAGVEMPGERY